MLTSAAGAQASRSPIELARVTLASGRVLEAEHVLLTAPPSVWNRIAFDPLLPVTLMPQMGSNVKCLIALKNRFWRRRASHLIRSPMVPST